MAEKLHTEIRQQQIAEAALGLIAQHGARRVSVAAVARRVGIVPSALYRHFGGKDAIIDAVFDLIRERLLDNVHQVAAATPDALDRLGQIVARHVAMLQQQKGMLHVVFSGEAPPTRHGRRAKVLRIVEAYLRALADIVRAGQEQGRIRPDVDPGTVALLVLGVVQPAVLLWHMSEGRTQVDVERHAREAWGLVRKAIAAG